MEEPRLGLSTVTPGMTQRGEWEPRPHSGFAALIRCKDGTRCVGLGRSTVSKVTSSFTHICNGALDPRVGHHPVLLQMELNIYKSIVKKMFERI